MTEIALEYKSQKSEMKLRNVWRTFKTKTIKKNVLRISLRHTSFF